MPTDQELADKVIAIIAEVKRASPETIRRDASFEELGIDSLDRINILFELESAFDIDVPDEEARSISSVDGIISRLGVYMKAQGKGN